MLSLKMDNGYTIIGTRQTFQNPDSESGGLNDTFILHKFLTTGSTLGGVEGERFSRSKTALALCKERNN